MEKKDEIRKFGTGGFLTLKELGEKEFLEEIFPEKKDNRFIHAEHIYNRIWGKEGKLKRECAYKSSIDLRLGREVFLSTKKEPINIEKDDTAVTINPGEFALLQTLEKIYIPVYLMAFISVRYSYKKKGLINVSGFHVDPGYEGYITFSVYNAGPSSVVLRYGDSVFTIFFATLTQSVDVARRDVPEVLIKGYTNRIPSSDIEEIKGPPISLPQLDERLTKVESNLKWLIAILIAFFGAALAAIFAK